ncbi:hypothetical protein CLAIMM_09119 [Cladophialophora immunda]|nr:hypothetical protein CLAIMM_09119 [Cladophialophora immunda]
MASTASRPIQGYISMISENGNFGSFFWELKAGERKMQDQETWSLHNNAGSDLETRDREEPRGEATVTDKDKPAGQPKAGERVP